MEKAPACSFNDTMRNIIIPTRNANQSMAKLITLLGFILLLISACAPKPSEPVTIGIITPLTGSLASLGETVQRAANLAIGEINANGGINGKPLKIIVEDSKGSISTAVLAANKLINIDNVPVLVEVVTSGEAAAIAPIAQAAGVIDYSVLATTETLVDAGDYVFKMREGALPHVQAITQAMQKEGMQNVAVLQLNDEYCTNTIKQFESEAQKAGLNILAIEKYQTDDTDVRTQIAKIKATPAQGVYVCGFYQELGLVFKQIHETNMSKRLFSVTTFEHPLVKKNAGPAALEGTIYSVSPFDCASAKGFCEKYQTLYNQKPDYRAAFVYDAINIIAQALKQNTDPARLKDVLLTTRYSGTTGITTFDEKGNSVKDVVLHQVKNNEWSAYP